MDYICKYNNVQPFMLGINGFFIEIEGGAYYEE